MVNIICAKCGKLLSEDELHNKKCTYCQTHLNEIKDVSFNKPQRELTKLDWDIINQAFKYRYTELPKEDKVDDSTPIKLENTLISDIPISDVSKKELPTYLIKTESTNNIDNPFDENRVGYYKNELEPQKHKSYSWIWLVIVIVLILLMYKINNP